MDRKRVLRGALLALGLCLAGPAKADPGSLVLVPPPAQLEWLPGTAEFAPWWTVQLPGGTPADSFAASLLIEDVKTRFGWRLSLGDQPGPGIVIRASRPSHRSNELWGRQGYEVEVWIDSIVVRAPTAAGRYYGVQTLRQIVRGTRDGLVPGCVIRDGPGFEWRGLSEDVGSGRMPTMDEFRRTIAALGYYKANFYQLHLGDAFEFRGAPEVGRGQPRLSPAHLAEIVEEGRRHHVAVIPIFETLGPQRRLLSTPGFRRLAETQPVTTLPWTWRTAGRKLAWLAQSVWFGRGAEAEEAPAPWAFSPTLPATREFVKARITELSEAAPGEWFHIGGRSAPDVGSGVSGTPGPVHRAELLAGYFGDLAVHVRSHRRRTLVYVDELVTEPRALVRLSRDATPVYRNHRGDGADSALYAIRAAGFPRVHVSPGLWDWEGFAPRLDRAFPNIANLVERGAGAMAEGVVAGSWGGSTRSFPALNWPGIAYATEAAWVGAADTSGTFLQRFTTVHYGARGRALAEAIERVGRQDFEAELGDARIGEREPVPVLRLNAWLADCRALEQEMTRARAQIASERPRWNRDELDYLDLAARRVVHVARREQMLHDVAGLDLPSVNTRSRRARRLERDLRALSEESAAIEVRFEELWRERYEAGGLKAGLAPLERQAAGLDSVWSRTFPGAAPVAKSRYVKPATPLPRLTPSELRRLAAERAKQSTLELSLGY